MKLGLVWMCLIHVLVFLCCKMVSSSYLFQVYNQANFFPTCSSLKFIHLTLTNILRFHIMLFVLGKNVIQVIFVLNSLMWLHVEFYKEKKLKEHEIIKKSILKISQIK